MTDTVLILGGTGFLGWHTVKALKDAGYNIRIFDQAPPTQTLGEGIEFIAGDILDKEAVSKAAKGIKYIYHFAGIADIEESNQDPERTCAVNITGTLNVLQAAVTEKVERLVFSSSVYVYSNSGGFYRTTKQTCENLIENYNEYYNLPFTILRYGSLYGPGAGPTNGIYKLIKSALTEKEITYHGDPDATREYIHVQDAARLSVEILGEKYKNGHYILTGQERMKVVDLMRMISEMLPNKPELKFGEINLAAHYVMTPYKYAPNLGHKLTLNDRIDLGQGLLQCIGQIHQESTSIPETEIVRKKA